MIPILFDRYETEFTSNGIGRLYDCISCLVTEERNGVYECEFEYPITGAYYSNIEHGMIVYATHDDTEEPQPFVVYAHSAIIDGIVTFYAHHISYRLNDIVVNPFTATSCAEAILGIRNNSINSNPFTFWTDKSTTGEFASTVPREARALLGGEEGSLLDVYGKGDYEWDHFAVRLHADRGADTQVEIRYGKNLSDLTEEVDSGALFDAVVPYWQGTTEPEDGGESEEILIMLPERVVSYAGASETLDLLANENLELIQTQDSVDIEISGQSLRTVPLDLTDLFEEPPTAAELRAAALSYLENAQGWLPVENLTVDFVQLWQTEEYAEYAPLQRVRLCDRVSVYFPEMGVLRVKQKVVKTVYNVLLDRYDSIELGELETTLGQEIRDSLDMSQYATGNDLTRLKDDLSRIANDLEDQIDGKIQTWYQSADPSVLWTEEEKPTHDGDLWCYTGPTTSTRTRLAIYRYEYSEGSGTWEEYDATDELFDAIDGKTTIFYGPPTGSYSGVETGDYLVDATDGCTYRWGGSSWVKLTDYMSAINGMQSTLEAAITNATQKITGGLGGYVYMKPNANGEPEEILIMNTKNYATATKIWRWNLNGLGYSKTGYNGTFGTAITMDGAIVADYITTGILNANIIKAGILQDANGNTSLNMSTGVLTMKRGSINLGDGAFTVNDSGHLHAEDVDIGGFHLTDDIDGNYAFYQDSTVNGVKYRTWIRSATSDDGGKDTFAFSTQYGSGNSTFYVTSGGDLYCQPLKNKNTKGSVIVDITSDAVHLEYSSTKVLDIQNDWLSLQWGYRQVLMDSDGTSIYGGNGYGLIRVTANTARMDSEKGQVLVNANGLTLITGRSTSSHRGNLYITGAGVAYYALEGSSSRLIKDHIKAIEKEELRPERLLDLDVLQFRYKDDFLSEDDDNRGRDLVGFIIEDLEEIYPTAVEKDDKSDPKTWTWSPTMIVPPMLKLIQDQHKEIEGLKTKLTEIESRIAALEKERE